MATCGCKLTGVAASPFGVTWWRAASPLRRRTCRQDRGPRASWSPPRQQRTAVLRSFSFGRQLKQWALKKTGVMAPAAPGCQRRLEESQGKGKIQGRTMQWRFRQLGSLPAHCGRHTCDQPPLPGSLCSPCRRSRTASIAAANKHEDNM